MPMRSGQRKMMACCKAALEKSKAPRVAKARLCCAMNCGEPLSTNGNAGQTFSQTIAPQSATIGLRLPAVAVSDTVDRDYSRNTFLAKEPVYILNLTLLI